MDAPLGEAAAEAAFATPAEPPILSAGSAGSAGGLRGSPLRLRMKPPPSCPFRTPMRELCCSFNPWKVGRPGPGAPGLPWRRYLSAACLPAEPVGVPPVPETPLAEQASSGPLPQIAMAAALPRAPAPLSAGTSGSPGPLQVVQEERSFAGEGWGPPGSANRELQPESPASQVAASTSSRPPPPLGKRLLLSRYQG